MVLDNKSTPIGSAQAANEAVRHQVTAVIGASWSSHALGMAPILQKAGIPMISPVSTNPKVTRIGNCIFRVCFLDSAQGKAMAGVAYKELDARTATVLKIIDEEHRLILAKLFVNAFEAYGGRVLFEASYRSKAVDFSNLLEHVKRHQPDVVFLPGYPRDSGLLMKQAVAMGLETTFLGGDGFNEIVAYGGEAIEGAYYSTHWHPEVPSEKSARLQDLYAKKYSHRITHLNAPLAYDAVMVLAAAIRQSNSLDHANIMAPWLKPRISKA